MLPGSDTLISISKALQLPIEYFFRTSINIGTVNFRIDERIPTHSTAQMEAVAQDKVERYLMLEDLLSIHTTFKNPLRSYSVTTPQEAEEAANLLRKKWQLGTLPIFSAYEMLEYVGIKLLEFETGNTHVLGFSTIVKRNIPIIVINLSANSTVERKRFTALHELGHILLNIPEKTDKKTRERLCHLFSAALLCPATVLFNELGHKRTAIALDELTSLKSRYGISVAAIVHRAKDLGIINDAYYNQIFDQRIHQNPLEEGWGGYPIPEQTNRFERLLYRATAERVISLSRAAEIANEKLGDYREKLVVV